MWRSMPRTEVDRPASIDYQHGRPSLESGSQKASGSSDLRQGDQQRGSGSFPGDLREAITGLHTKDSYRGDLRSSVEGRYHDSRDSGAGSAYPQDFRDSMENAYQRKSDLRNSISRPSYREVSETNARTDSGSSMLKEPVSRPFERDLRDMISGSTSREFRQSAVGLEGGKESVSDGYARDLRDSIARSNQGSPDYCDSSGDNQHKRKVSVDHFSRESSISAHSRDTEGGYYQRETDRVGKGSSGMGHRGKESMGHFQRGSRSRGLDDNDFAFLAKTLKDGVDPKLGWSKGSNPFLESVGMTSSSGLTASQMSDYKKSYHQQVESSIPQTTSYILENSALMMNMNSTPVSISSTAIKPHSVASISNNPQLLPTSGLGVNLQANLYSGNDLMFLNSLQNRNQSVVSLAPVVMSTPLQIRETATVSKGGSVTLGGSFWDTIKKEGLLTYVKTPVKMTVDSTELDTTHAVGEDFQIPSFPKKHTSGIKRSRSRSPCRKSHSSTGRRGSDDSRKSPGKEKRYRRSVSPRHRSEVLRERPSRQIREKSQRHTGIAMSRKQSLSPRRERIRSRTPENISSHSRGHAQERSRHSREASPRMYRERSPRMGRERSPRMIREMSPRRLRKEQPQQRSREMSPQMMREKSPRRLRERSPRMTRDISPMLRERSPQIQRQRSRMVREMSPRMVRERSPRMARERSPRMMNERPRIVREISPTMERDSSPRMLREMSPHHLRHRGEMSPRRSRDISRGSPRFSHERSPRMLRGHSRERSPCGIRTMSPDVLREREMMRGRERTPLRHSPGRSGFVRRHSRSPGNVRGMSPEHFIRPSPELIRRHSPERFRGPSPELIRRHNPGRHRDYSPELVRVLTPERFPDESHRSHSPVPVRILPPERVSRYPLEDHRRPSPQRYSRHPLNRNQLRRMAIGHKNHKSINQPMNRKYPSVRRGLPSSRQISSPGLGSKPATGREQSPYLRDIDSPPHDLQHSPHMASGSPQVARRFSPDEDRESPRRSWDTRNKRKRRKRRRLRVHQLQGRGRELVVLKGMKTDSVSSKETQNSSLELNRDTPTENHRNSPFDLALEASPVSLESNGDDDFGERGESPLFDEVSPSPKSAKAAASPGTPTSDERHKPWVDSDLQRGCSPVSLSEFPAEQGNGDKESIDLQRDLSPVSLEENSLDTRLEGSVKEERSKSPLSDASRGSLIVTDSVDVQDSPQGAGEKDGEDLRVQLLRLKEEKVEQKLKKLEEESLETELRLQNLSPDILDYSPQRDTPSPLLDECEDERRPESFNRKFYGF